MVQQGFHKAKRRYHRALWPVLGIYFTAVIGGSFMLRRYEEPPFELSVGVAIACSAPLFLLLLVMLRYFAETDEYTRLRQLIAFARGAALTVSAIFLFGFLQMFHVIENVAVFWFGPLFLVSWGLFYCLSERLWKPV